MLRFNEFNPQFGIKKYKIIFNYGDNLDPSTSVKCSNGKTSFINIQNLSKKLNEKYEFSNNL